MPHVRCDPRGAVPSDPLGKIAAKRSADDKQHVEENRLQRGRDRQRQRVGHPFRAEYPQQHFDQSLNRAGLLQDRSHQHAEGDEQSDLGHDLTEAPGDGVDSALNAEADSQAEIGGSDDQRNDWVEFEPDDHHHHGEDRHRGIDDDCGLRHA